MNMTVTMTLTDLYIYPVKSLAGIRLSEATADIRGLADDRRWMLINETNKFITQRQLSALARIRTRLSADTLWLSCGEREIAISRAPLTGPAFGAQIWNDTVQVIDEGPAVSQWLADVLGRHKPLRLVRLAARRPQSKPWYLGPDTHTEFADMAPLLVANRASLAALNSALAARGLQPVPMDRFRPNLVLDGLPAFAEHAIRGLKADGYAIRFAYPCERCVVPTIDQATGVKHPDLEPFRTLVDINAMPAYGQGEYAKPANPKGPAFGENACLEGAAAHLRVGDALAIWP